MYTRKFGEDARRVAVILTGIAIDVWIEIVHQWRHSDSIWDTNFGVLGDSHLAQSRRCGVDTIQTSRETALLAAVAYDLSDFFR